MSMPDRQRAAETWYRLGRRKSAFRDPAGERLSLRMTGNWPRFERQPRGRDRDRCPQAARSALMRGQRSSLLLHVVANARCHSSPTIAEGRGGLDLGEGRIDLAEFASDPLDAGSNVGPISLVSQAADETFITHPVVDGAVGQIATHVGHQKIDDAVFGDRQVDVDAIPG